MAKEQQTIDKRIIESAKKWLQLPERMAFGIVAILLAAFVTISGGIIFIAGIVAITSLITMEWFALTQNKQNLHMRYWGVAYSGIFATSCIWLREYADFGAESGSLAAVMYLILLVSATDIGAYFVGKIFQGPKLCEKISPSKTISGAIGGLICGGVAGFISSFFVDYPETMLGTITVIILVSVVAQIGDLLASWLKRKAGIVDSSNLIPGHGGIIDLLDGYILAVPFYALLVLIN